MVYQIKVQLRGATKPPVWRRFLVPSNASFEDLRSIIMIGFGWMGGHLYNFTEYPYQGMLNIFDPEEDIFSFDMDEEPSHIACKTKISTFLNPVSPKMLFTYDMGDNWEHLITLEDDNVRNCKDPQHAHCIDGKGQCPPEDCGGIYAYTELKEFVLSHPEKAILAAFEDELGVGVDDVDFEEEGDDDENYYLEQIRYYGPFFNVIKGKPDFNKIDLAEVEQHVSGFKIKGAMSLKRKRKMEEELYKRESTPTGDMDYNNEVKDIMDLIQNARVELDKYKGIDEPEDSEKSE